MFHDKVDLTPERTWIHELRNADSEAKYTFEIQDAKGATLLRQTESEYDWAPASEVHVGPQPRITFPKPDKRTYDDWIQLGNEDELNGRTLKALEIYKETLAKFPGGLQAGKAAGRVAASLLRFEEAKDFLSRCICAIRLTLKFPITSASHMTGSVKKPARELLTKRRSACRCFLPRRLCG